MTENQNHNLYSKHDAGVSLIETCIMVIVMGLFTVIGMTMAQYQQRLVLAERNSDIIQAAQDSLSDYFSRNGQLPCPAPRNDVVDTPSFGIAMKGLPDEKDCAASPVNWPATAQRLGTDGRMVRVGALPVRTLGLPDKFMFDAWGNRLIYAVTEDFASPDAPISSAQGAITIEDSAGNNSTSEDGNVVYTLLSFGDDRRGAYNINGTMAQACDPASTGGVNCNDPAGVTVAANFVNTLSKGYNDDAASGNTYTYDVAYMVNQIAPASGGGTPGGYYWYEGSWGACSVPCGTSTRTRVVECRQAGSDAIVDSSLCTGVAPITSEPCSATCSWETGLYGTCSNTCGAGIQNRPVICINSQSTVINDSYCIANVGPRPQHEQGCSAETGCNYAWRYNAWSVCSNTCGGNQTRTAYCVRLNDDVTVPNGFCAALPQESLTQACGDSTQPSCNPDPPCGTTNVTVCIHDGEFCENSTSTSTVSNSGIAYAERYQVSARANIRIGYISGVINVSCLAEEARSFSMIEDSCMATGTQRINGVTYTLRVVLRRSRIPPVTTTTSVNVATATLTSVGSCN